MYKIAKTITTHKAQHQSIFYIQFAHRQCKLWSQLYTHRMHISRTRSYIRLHIKMLVDRQIGIYIEVRMRTIGQVMPITHM